MSSKIPDSEVRRRRAEFRNAHRYCWAMLTKSDGIYVCMAYCRTGYWPHHLARGRGRDEHESLANYYPLADPPIDNHHMGYAHAQDPSYGLTERETRLWMFAFKYLIGEATIEEIEFLMKGRRWWESSYMAPDMTLRMVINDRASALQRSVRNLDFVKKKLARGGDAVIL